MSAVVHKEWVWLPSYPNQQRGSQVPARQGVKCPQHAESQIASFILCKLVLL